jgi:predicted RNA-binding protein YlqC (UPF0109 family)
MDNAQNPQDEHAMVDLSPESDNFNDEGRPNITSEQLTEFIRYIVLNIVTNKEAVQINVTEGTPGSYTVNIAVAQEDKGRVIGKKGNTINAIRSLVRVFGRIIVLLQD